MDWLEVTVKTSSQGIDHVADRLTAMGIDSFIIDDEADFNSFLEENTKYWDYVDEELSRQMSGLSQIRFYIQDDDQAEGTMARLRTQLDALRSSCSADLGSLEVTSRITRDEDWENSWKQYYEPIEIGSRLLINPCWMEPPQGSDRIVVSLDPGVAFGTGSHASTRMCLEELETRVKGGETLVDLGSGSGILSIAALHLGVKSAVGVDIDDKAADAARENAAINGFAEPEFVSLCGNVLGKDRPELGKYDIVLANIVADVIIPLSAVVKDYMLDTSLFICSGILNTRADEVIAALEAHGLHIISRRDSEDWVQLTARLVNS